MFIVEGASSAQIVVRHRSEDHGWRFSMGFDARRKARIITSGISSRNHDASERAVDVAEALRFASVEARRRNLID